MQEINLNGKVIGYTDNPKEIKKYLPEGTPSKFEMLDRTDRKLVYGDDVYTILKTNKKKGTGEGDICTICTIGILQNQGGCYTCSVCNASLKCGL